MRKGLVLISMVTGCLCFGQVVSTPLLHKASITEKSYSKTLSLRAFKDSVPINSGETAGFALPPVAGGTIFNPQLAIEVPEGAESLHVEFAAEGLLEDIDFFVRFGEEVAISPEGALLGLGNCRASAPLAIRPQSGSRGGRPTIRHKKPGG